SRPGTPTTPRSSGCSSLGRMIGTRPTAIGNEAVVVIVPSPLVGEGYSEVQQGWRGEGGSPNPSPNRVCRMFGDALSHKGRGRINCHRAILLQEKPRCSPSRAT